MSLPDTLTALIFGAVGVLHLLPGLAFFAPKLLTRLYGSLAQGPVLLMLQHRAVLLMIVGALLMFAAFYEDWRLRAAAAGVISMAAYLWLYARAPAVDRAPLHRIAIADTVALPALLGAVWIELSA